MKDNRQRYHVVCPSCKRTIYVCKSIAQEMGIDDMGSGTCINCKTRLHLTYNKEKQEMDAVLFEDWINERKQEADTR